MKYVLLFAAVFTNFCWAQSMDGLQNSCNAGNGADCTSLGNLYYEGKDIPQSYDDARKYFDKACELGDGQGCSNLGNIYRAGQGVEKSYETAFELFKKSCESGNSQGCFNYGSAFYSGQGVEASNQKALELFTKACDADYGQACVAVGNMYRNAQGVKQSSVKAIEYYEKACNMGIGAGCNPIGVLYFNGKGVPQSYDKTVQYYNKACELGYGRGCSNLGYLYKKGLAVQLSLEKAVELYTRSCDLGLSDGCNSLGLMYENGEGVAQSIDKAVELYRKSCDSNNTTGCKELARLNEQQGNSNTNVASTDEPKVVSGAAQPAVNQGSNVVRKVSALNAKFNQCRNEYNKVSADAEKQLAKAKRTDINSVPALHEKLQRQINEQAQKCKDIKAQIKAVENDSAKYAKIENTEPGKKQGPNIRCFQLGQNWEEFSQCARSIDLNPEILLNSTFPPEQIGRNNSSSHIGEIVNISKRRNVFIAGPLTAVLDAQNRIENITVIGPSFWGATDFNENFLHALMRNYHISKLSPDMLNITDIFFPLGDHFLPYYKYDGDGWSIRLSSKTNYEFVSFIRTSSKADYKF